MSTLAKIAVLTAIAAFSGSATAECWHSGGTDYCGPELIQMLYLAAHGPVYIQPSTSLATLPAGFTCKPVSGAYFALNPAAPNFKHIYATLLSARLSGTPVTMILDPTQAQCTITYVTV